MSAAAASSSSPLPSLETQCLRSHGRYNGLREDGSIISHASVSVLRAKAAQLASNPAASADLSQLATRLNAKPGDGEVWEAINQRWSAAGTGIPIDQLRAILTNEFGSGPIIVDKDDENDAPAPGADEVRNRPDIDEIQAQQQARGVESGPAPQGWTPAQQEALFKSAQDTAQAVISLHTDAQGNHHY